MAQITAGIELSYQVETVAGTKPVSTWTRIHGITEMPEFGSTPDTLETTSLDNTVYKTYVSGLLDTGGVLAFKANDTDTFRTEVGTMLTAQDSGELTGLSLWFKLYVPAPVNRNISFQGKASPLGFGGAGINSVLQTTLNIVPTKEPAWTAGA